MLDWLVRRAKRTPYFHLDGYMNRWWLVPYRQKLWREWVEGEGADSSLRGSYDNTGPVEFRERPLAWLLQRCGIAVRVHEILRSDEGRHPHNHPWWYLSIILRGWYWEDRYDARGQIVSGRFYGPGSIIFRPADSWHMLTLWSDAMVTTLFITGKKSQSWGFNVDGQQVPHRQYEGKQ